MSETLYIASDHAGISLKSQLIEHLKKNFIFKDLGPHSEESVDYPDFAEAVAKKVAQENVKGILVCGSGIGMAIAANKIKGVRAANVWDVTSARLSREHNDANIICLGSRLTGSLVAQEMVEVFLKTNFQGSRHQNRLDKIKKLEEK